MARTKRVKKKKAGERARVSTRKTAPARRRRTPSRQPPVPALKGATRRDAGNVRLEIGRAGAARVKRVIYPAGFRWSVDMRPLVGTELCMHAHVGYLERGAIRIEYADGCTIDYVAPQIVAIDPGHDGSVVGDAPAVLIELDFERDTIERLGMPASHRHA